MPTDDAYQAIDAAATILGLSIQPEWKPNILLFYDVARGMAKMIEATGAVTAVEAAPVFAPRSDL